MSVPQELDFKQSSQVKPNYGLLRINQQSGGNSVTLSKTASVQSVFELPAQVMNFSKSFLQFQISMTGLNGKFCNIIDSGTLSPIRSLVLTTQSGLRLVDIPDVGKYSKCVQLSDTKLSEFLTMDKSTGFSASDADGGASGNYTVSVDAGDDPAPANARTFNTKGYTEPLGFHTGVVDAGGGEGAIAIMYRIPLSMIKNTLLQRNKDIYFDEIVNLQIDWRPTDLSTVTSDAVTVAAQIAAATVPTLTELYFYVAQQKNESIAKAIRDKVRSSGMSVLVDYLYAYNSSQTGTNHSLSFRWSRAHGRRLKRVYCVPYIASNVTVSNYYNHARDQDGDAVLTVYSQIDNERIQQFNMDSAAQDEHLVMGDKLKGSVIQTRTQFDLNYFYADSWDGLKFHERQDGVECGLDLSSERKYDLVATAEGARNWHVFAVVQRMLKITSDGISLD